MDTNVSETVYPAAGENDWSDRTFFWPPMAESMSKMVCVPVQVKYRIYRVPSWALYSDWMLKRHHWPQELMRYDPAKHFIAHGGLTVCIMRTEDQELVSLGIAICSMEDLFSAKRGKRIAFARARDAMMDHGVPILEPKYDSKVIKNIVDSLLKFYYGK